MAYKSGAGNDGVEWRSAISRGGCWQPLSSVDDMELNGVRHFAGVEREGLAS